jgi:opacity protein-like surface antigen
MPAMKNIFRSLAMIGAGFAFAWPETGRSQEFYLNANAGVSLANDVALHRFLVPTPGAKVKLDPGARLSVAGGYNINGYLGVQFETGCNYNSVKSISGRGDIDASLSHIPMLGDVVVRYDKADCKWVPYAGAGAGGDASSISLDHVRAPNGQVVDNSATDVVFAWQAFAGVRYKFARNMSLGGGYKFFWADGASWDVRRSSGAIETGSARVHSFGADFTWKF